MAEGVTGGAGEVLVVDPDEVIKQLLKAMRYGDPGRWEELELLTEDGPAEFAMDLSGGNPPADADSVYDWGVIFIFPLGEVEAELLSNTRELMDFCTGVKFRKWSFYDDGPYEGEALFELGEDGVWKKNEGKTDLNETDVNSFLAMIAHN